MVYFNQVDILKEKLSSVIDREKLTNHDIYIETERYELCVFILLLLLL